MKRLYMYTGKQHLLVLSLALLLILLAACGTNGANTTTGSGNTSTASGSATSSSSSTTPGAQDCGTVHSLRLQVVPTDRVHALSNENCFWQAFQQCRSATLSYSQASVDTANIHTFSLKSQGSTCIITDTVKHQVLPHPAQPIATYTCTSLTQQKDGLHFSSCGTEGDIIVPTGGVE